MEGIARVGGGKMLTYVEGKCLTLQDDVLETGRGEGKCITIIKSKGQNSASAKFCPPSL